MRRKRVFRVRIKSLEKLPDFLRRTRVLPTANTADDLVPAGARPADYDTVQAIAYASQMRLLSDTWQDQASTFSSETDAKARHVSNTCLSQPKNRESGPIHDKLNTASPYPGGRMLSVTTCFSLGCKCGFAATTFPVCIGSPSSTSVA